MTLDVEDDDEFDSLLEHEDELKPSSSSQTNILDRIHNTKFLFVIDSRTGNVLVCKTALMKRFFKSHPTTPVSIHYFYRNYLSYLINYPPFYSLLSETTPDITNEIIGNWQYQADDTQLGKFVKIYPHDQKDSVHKT